eukprot:3098618-Pleurochrysis_carterae.AAC.1
MHWHSLARAHTQRVRVLRMRQRRGVGDGRTKRLAPNAKLRWALPLHETTATPCVAGLPVAHNLA